MSESLDLRDIQTLRDLQAALGRFASEAQEGLRTADAEIGRAQEWLSERVNHWQREVKDAKQAVTHADTDLRRCEASGYRDEDGYYHLPDCSRQTRALRQAEARLRECEENLQTAQVWRSRLEQAVSEYQREARRLSDLAGGHTEKARASLAQTAAKYEAAQAAANAVGGLGTAIAAGMIGLASSRSPQAASSLDAPRGITWAEKRSILKKMDIGQSITAEEFEKLKLPISDLKAETLQPDYSWVRQLIEGERFREATQGFWTGRRCVLALRSG